MPAAVWQRWGAILTTDSEHNSVGQLFSSTKKRSLLPLLTVLFLFSYGLMTLLIVFQNSTIQSQRNFILQLLDDSRQLWALKAKAVQDGISADTHRHGKAPSSQAQTPSTQAPSTQAPSTQVVPQRRTQHQAGKTAKPRIQLPPQPAADPGDQRRVLMTI